MPTLNQQESCIGIPKSSFTAFRLTYSNPQDISESSKCILLGRIPDIWSHDQGPGFLSSTTHHAKNKVKEKFRSAATTVNSSIRSGSSMKVEESHSDIQEGGFNLFFRKNKEFDTAGVIRKIHEGTMSNDGDSDEGSSFSDRSSSFNLSQDPGAIRTSSPSSFHQDSDLEAISPVKSYFYPNHHKQAEANVPIINELKTSSNDPSLKPPISTSAINNWNGYVFSKDGLTLNNLTLTPTVSFDPKLMKKTSRISSKRGMVSLTLPEPSEEVKGDVLAVEREHLRIMKRLKRFALTSKGKAKKKSSGLRSMIYRAVLKNYKAGEVVRMDKMLVLIKEAYNFNQATKFSENEPCDSRVYERWKEFFVVLRKTDDAAEPLAIQFYDIYNTAIETKGGPEISFRLSTSINAQFYSHSDKSLCLTVPQNLGIFIYILKCHNQATSFKWLFFIKQILGHDLDPLFHINIPSLSLALVIRVPESIVLEMLQNMTTSLKVKILEKGYKVEYARLIEYLRNSIINELNNRKISQVDDWLIHNPNLWFCFKYYDRLEWVMNNSESFYMQNQLLTKAYQLEFRNMGHYIRETRLRNGEIMKEPYPIEGFLSRLTNTSGNERSLLRTFHKISYFYTCDNILFFTKYFRGVPPSPNNAFLNNEDSITNITLKLPPVYEHSPFPIDERHHITWLNEKDFEYHDQLALAELERRAQQIIKAEALIDICLIKDIRAIPSKKVKKAQKLLLCLLWYSDVSLMDDESISDSAFEIEMVNGSILKLQAPKRESRDEWVSRLNQLREYWVSRKSDDLDRLLEVRRRNQSILRITEYVDSNITQEGNNIEIKHSTADPFIHNIDSISMSKPVLISGYLYQKHKKHSNFNQYFVVLCPGFMLLFSMYKRSKKTGVWKKTSYFEHYLTIPISECYIYSGIITSLDLLERQNEIDPMNPGHHSLPRLYPDGWKSSEEETLRCFTLWFGKKRQITRHDKILSKNNLDVNRYKNSTPKNPGLLKMIRKLGLTGKSIVFMARSRQEREIWVYKIYSEIDRFSK